MFPLAEVAFVAVSLAIFAYFTGLRKSLSNAGIIFGLLVGVAVVILGGFNSYVVLLGFYVIAELATGYARKKTGERHEKRSTSNIIGNSAAALIALALGQRLAFFGALAASLSDTVSGEIGLLSRKKPVLITSLMEVDSGTDGGITSLGILAGTFAAVLMGAIYYFTTYIPVEAGIIIICGIVGMLVDSILGDLFERRGMMNNTQVNFIASLCGAVTAILLQFMF